MKLLYKFLSTKIKNRIELIQNDFKNPIQCQQKIMQLNVKFASKTLFGKNHNFLPF